MRLARRVVGPGEEVREVVGLLVREGERAEGPEGRGEAIVDMAEREKERGARFWAGG